MTLQEAKAELAKPVEEDEEGVAWIPFLVRENRPGVTLFDYQTHRFWTQGVVLVGLPPESQRAPFTDEDEAAADWGITLYPS